MDGELEGPRKLKRKGERRTSSRPRKRHTATVRAPGAGASQKEECRAVIRSLLGSFNGFTVGGSAGAAEGAYEEHPGRGR